jgi:hydroxypyruvate isomerase
MRLMGDDLAATIETNLSRIGHIQLADAPGRHEPGTGEIDFRSLFQLIDRLGYRGWMGAEYTPTGSTEESLAWAKDYL